MSDRGGSSADTLREKRIAFHAYWAGSLVLCVLVHLLSPLFAHTELPRLCMVLVFFGCLASATWSLTSPYAEYLGASVRWRYADAGAAVRNDASRYARRQARFFSGIGRAATGVVGLVALTVLSHWTIFEPALGPVRDVLYWGAILGTVGLPAAGLLGLGSLREAQAIKRQIDEQMDISGMSERTADSESRRREAAGAPAVSVSAPTRFVAGGYEWRWSDYYKNAAIFGQSGTGKTICVLNGILDGLLASARPGEDAPSGLILDPKGDYRDKITSLCARHGRAGDLVILDPDDLAGTIRWNPFDSPDDPIEVTGRFGAMMETVNPSGSDDKSFIEASKRLLQNLISVIRHARPETPPSMVELHDAAMSDEVLDNWGRALAPETIEGSREVARAIEYFTHTWRPMPDNTKGSVRFFVSNMLGSFLVEPYDELFAGRSDVTVPEIIDSGKILYVHMPIADREIMAKVVSTLIKLEFYKEVLKRPNKRRPSFFLCDEFQSYFTAGQGRGDSDAFQRTRQSNHANIVAFQNIQALLKQTDKREPVMDLLGNCAIKIFLRNTDADTNEYASTLFGERIETLSSTSTSIGQGAAGRGRSSNVSGTAQYGAVVRKEEFSELAVPSQEDGVGHASSIVHMAARSAVEAKRLDWKVHPI